MGSGLILLLIVGAWLAVLVPMALRSHDAATALGTVDRFSDAMRVLSRRDAGARSREDDQPLVPAPAPRTRRGATPAARRRRALAVLLLVAVGTLVGVVVGPLWWLGPHLVADLLLVGFLGWLRSQAVVRAEREWRVAMGDRTTAQQARAWSPRQEWSADVPPAGGSSAVAAPVVPAPAVPSPREVVFDQEQLEGQEQLAPAAAGPPVQRSGGERVAGVTTPAPAPAPARGAQGAPWSPVPVPVPTYVTAARAPRRRVDLTVSRPSEQELGSAERSLGIDDQGPELEHILGRRAVGG